MRKNTTCFRNSHKFWKLAVGFQNRGSLHAESIRGGWYIVGWFPGLLSHPYKMFLGKRERVCAWAFIYAPVRLQLGSRSKSGVCCGTSTQPRSDRAGWTPSLELHKALSGTIALQSWRRRAASIPLLILGAFRAPDKGMTRMSMTAIHW